MHKKEFIKTVAKQSEATEKDVKIILDTILELISRELTRGREVNLTGFGKFYVKEYPEREIRTPQGKLKQISKRMSPRFKASRTLREECR